MAVLHEKEIGKVRKIAGYALSVIASFIIFMAGFMKLIGADELQQSMNSIPNFSDLMIFVGVLELVILVMYWIPRLSNIGFFLMASYAGGIIVAEMVIGEPPVPGIIVAVLFYVGTMLRKPSLSDLE